MKTKILYAVMGKILTDSVGAVTVLSITKMLDISKAGFVYYFRTKSDLFFEVLDKISEDKESGVLKDKYFVIPALIYAHFARDKKAARILRKCKTVHYAICAEGDHADVIRTAARHLFQGLEKKGDNYVNN